MGRPGVGNELTLLKEFLLRDQWRLFIEQQMVHAHSKLPINVLQAVRCPAIETSSFRQRVELPNII